MNRSEEMLSFLDLLDLDEDLIDARLQTIMKRSNHSNKHLSNALQLLQYKHLINSQDKSDCENDDEFDFTVTLIKNIQPDIVENVCKISKLVLSLNNSTLVSNSQHLIQQVLANIDLSQEMPRSAEVESDPSKALLYFKVCDSVLDAVIENGLKIDLLFMDMPLEKAICHADEKVKIHFITSTVPKIFKGIAGYNILDKVWAYVKELKDIEMALKVLSSLSDYYLPAVDAKGKVEIESEVVLHYELWRILLFGLMSTDYSYRKISVYLAKRAIDYISSKHKNIQIKSEIDTILFWDHRRSNDLRKQWDNFFILIDSLEEKQSNIVLPSLQLFGLITELHYFWINCAFNLGLKHDNSQVRLKCVQYRFKREINSLTEATVILRALDDINLYETAHDVKLIKGNVKYALNDEQIINILKAIPIAQLSPVPLYHLTDVLAEAELHVRFTSDQDAIEILTDIAKVPCNIIALRKAFHINIAQFIGKSCKGLGWRVYAIVFSLLQLGTNEIEDTENPMIATLDLKLTSNEVEKRRLYEYVTDTLADIDFGLLYLDKHSEDLNSYMEVIRNKIQNIANIANRQYSNKLDSLNDVLIILKIFTKCKEANSEARKTVQNVIMKEFKIILQYAFCLLTSDTALSVDESKTLFSYLLWPDELIQNAKDLVIQFYLNSVILLNAANIELEKTAFCMFIINNLSKNKTFIRNFKHEMLDIKGLIDLARIFEKREVHKAKSIGRLKNIFYEKHSETVNILLEDKDLQIDKHLENIIEYLDNITECGGYGCLYWILKIMNKILKFLTAKANNKLDIDQFIHRMWREIEELKTNHQNYSPCMEEFAHLITQDALLDLPEFNNTVILFYNKIIDYGPIKNNPLFYLSRELNAKAIKRHGQLVYILGELLLYCPVSRKDQRITDNLTVVNSGNKKFGINNNDIDLHFNFEIKYAAVVMLSRINESETLDIITSFITNKVDSIFKNKVRYHGNSQLHRTIQTGLQHLVFLLLIHPCVDLKTLNWCLQLLGKLPHQSSVRICLEWYITLSFYIQGRILNSDMLDLLKSSNVPIPSQFIIIYWLLKHKITNHTFTNEEYDFVMETLLLHTMGQLFNIRLHAQYLSTKLYPLNKNSSEKYDYTVKVINRTLTENASDKNFVKLKEDYFVREFDIVSNLTPYFLYSVMPKLCDSNNGEIENIELVTQAVKEINKNIRNNVSNIIKNEWTQCCIRDEDLFHFELNKYVESKAVDELEKAGTLQKKYIPWKNMSDVNTYETTKKRDTTSELIVVASLIDKLPNLGGMARTSEVFGVKTYVIDSIRHVQDKQFQGLSVSAERWIDIEEVRPGAPLKEYLNRKKAEGYTIVAAEQTSTGSKLQTFKFPKKTLLLLGHEKEGIPCNLLPLMDHCVEIPQQGFVRSLNVHVTAAIFVWEYARQNLL